MLRAARDEAMWLARLPGENPNPVVRASDAGIVLYCNLSAAYLPGWRCEINERLPMPLRHLVQQAFLDGKIVEQDLLLDKRIYTISVVPIAGHPYANVYGRDVTEHKKAEEALRESERRQREMTRLLELDQARLAAILKHLPVGVWIVDEQGRLTGNNPEADRIWAGEAPLLNDITEYQKYISWHPASGELLEAEEYPVAVALRTGEPVEPMETNIRRFDGSEGTVLASAAPVKDSRGKVMGVVGVNVDITERKKAEAHINDLLVLNEKILNHSSVGILTYKVTGQCVFANEKVASIVGTSVSELLTQNFHTIAAWKKSGLYDLAQQAISTQAPAIADIHHISTFGKNVWVTVHCITFQSKGEDHVLVSLSDITERKLAEEALQKSEERFAKAFHASPNAIIISRLADGLILEVNEGWSTIFGHKPDEVIGRTTPELGVYVNPEDRQKAIADLEENGFLRDFEVQMRLKSGEIRDASLSAERIELNGVPCLLAILRDITERKQAEQALRESERRLKRAQEIAHLGSWELDLVNNRLTWSDEVYRIFGLEPQQFPATYEAFLDAVHPEDRDAVDHAYSGSVQAGSDSYEIEHRVVRRSSGEIRIVHEKCEHFRNEDGQIIRSIGMVHDITERKQSEERFRSLADSMPQLVWTALPDGTVDYYNQRYEEYQDIKQVGAKAWDWAPVLHPDDLQPTVRAWQYSLKTGEIYQIEHRVRVADGSYCWHLSRGIPVYNENGEIARWFGTATNIHDLKLAQEQLKDYAERLERSNRELEQFAFMASHDLQEPLRKIEMFGDLLLERGISLNEQEREYLHRMRNAARRMRDMVTGLLQLSRVTTQGRPFVSVDLSQVTADVLTDMEEKIRHIDGRVEHAPLPVVEGDPVQLRQLMQNLVDNALKYHPPETPPHLKIHAKVLPEQVQILVEDQGIGFKQEDAERIFQPFQRLVGRSQYDGSGIGLAICRRIVERHAGNITARSQPGHGTTFIITLPVAHPKAPELS
jgi:hypothetical protein